MSARSRAWMLAVATALLSAVAAHASVSTLPVSFWGDGVTLERAETWLGAVNRVYAANGVRVQFTLAGVGPSRASSAEAEGWAGLNVLFLPPEEFPGAGIAQACLNVLPLTEASCFRTKVQSYVIDDSAPGYSASFYDQLMSLLLAHELGHNLGLEHAPGTLMSEELEGNTRLNASQVATLNETGPQAATPPVRAALGGLLLNGRFTVQAEWRTRAGAEGTGKPVALTADSGYLWFFTESNIEVTVKVLDACLFSTPRFWVFAAGMTDVEVDLQVTDLETGAQKSYRNGQGVAFLPIQDTDAFASCPATPGASQARSAAPSGRAGPPPGRRPASEGRTVRCGNQY